VIERQEVMSRASDLSLMPEVIEKDYVLGWILAGVFADPDLAPAWVFKGGTCLKKCFFETYRFSEDLDFTVSAWSHLDEAFLRERFTRVSAWIQDASGIEIPVDRLRFDVHPNKRGALTCEGRLYYRGPLGMRGDIPRVKLDLTVDELLVLPPVEQPISHPYSDLPAGGLQARCYAFPEIFAEKTRALGERSRPRDLYDVVNLFRHQDRRPEASEILGILRRKCEFKGVDVPTYASLAPAEPELRADFEAYWEPLPAYFQWLATGVSPSQPGPAPLRAGARVIRPALGLLGASGIPRSREFETIRFAAANRLCVDLGYRDSVRRIEPYSLRRSAEGALLLMAVRTDSGESRSYRVDHIQSVVVTGQVFAPRYAVELAAADLAIRPTVQGSTAGSFSAFPTKASLPRRESRRPRLGWGPTYVFQCGMCGKKFNRSSFDGALNAHKQPGGLPCSGRTGVLVATRQ
jgi:predicted nucleotidyltransferase component of viral defense system